jgi:hypothetical protein
MTKAQQEQPEGISARLLLASWNKTLEPIEEARRINKESGVRDPEQYIQFDDGAKPMKIMKYENWVESCINECNSEPFTLESLIASGTINKSEISFYPSEVYPYRELITMSRILSADKKNQWLSRGEMWYGVDKAGAIKNVYVDTLDIIKVISPTFEFVSIDPTRRGAKEVRIARVGRSTPWYEGSRKTYTNKFSAESVGAAMRDARQPTTDPTITNTSLALVKEGAPNPCSVPYSNLESFINADFLELWKQQTEPSPVIRVDSRSLLSHIQSAEMTDQYQ